jgi:RHS repeat-associated protein
LASANCPATVNENAGRSYLILVNSGDADSFKYDPFGRRIYKSSSSGTSVYAYDGDNLIEETNASGGVVARYSQGLNIDEPLAMLRGGTTSYYQADGLGSLTSLSNTSGALANTYTYDSFGSLTASTGSLTNSFRYTGREFDAETSLYYYRARYYDSGTGRFIDEDPSAQGSNFYRYVENDPTDLVDPLGLYTIAPAKPGHPVTPPPSPALDKLLNCMENRLHISLTVTSTTEGKHQDPGHAAGTSVDIRPPSGISADAVFCAAGQCGSPWGINEGQTGSPTPYTTGFNYHIQLRPPNSPHPKSKNAIPANCTPPSCSASN